MAGLVVLQVHGDRCATTLGDSEPAPFVMPTDGEVCKSTHHNSATWLLATVVPAYVLEHTAHIPTNECTPRPLAHSRARLPRLISSLRTALPVELDAGRIGNWNLGEVFLTYCFVSSEVPAVIMLGICAVYNASLLSVFYAFSWVIFGMFFHPFPPKVRKPSTRVQHESTFIEW